MKVVISDDYLDCVRTLDCYSKMSAHDVTIYTDTVKDVDAIAERYHPADAVVLIRERTRITDELLSKLPNLKFISSTGGGIRHIDVEACTRHGVAIAAHGTGNPWQRFSGSASQEVELVWGLILSAARNLPQEVQALKEGRWVISLGDRLHGKTLGIYGYGRIGRPVGRVGEALGMRVLVWGRETTAQRAKEDGVEMAASREEFFSTSNVLTIHLPVVPSTYGIVTAADLALMKPTSILINASRAIIIEEGALVTALRAGRPGKAAVDVYEEEPVLGGDHPLLQMENVVCTPHLGYVTKEGHEAAFGAAFDRLNAYARGEPIGVVNPEVLG